MFDIHKNVSLQLTSNRLEIHSNPVHNQLNVSQCHLLITALGACKLVQRDAQTACDLVNRHRVKWTIEGEVRHFTITNGNRYPYRTAIEEDAVDICVFSHTLEDAFDRFSQAALAIFLASWIRACCYQRK